MLAPYRGASVPYRQIAYRAAIPGQSAKPPPPKPPSSLNPAGNVGLAGPFRVAIVATGRAVVWWLWVILGVVGLLAIIDLGVAAIAGELVRKR